MLVVDRGRRFGGVSVHTGTSPSKTLRETVLNLSGWRERGFYGRSYRVKQQITAVDLTQRLLKTFDHEVEVLEHWFMRNMVTYASGEARFIDTNHAEIATDTDEISRVSFDKALIAVGTHPFRPGNVPFDKKQVFDSDEILELEHLPRTLAVIGGGVIGVECATIFSALDVPVTPIEARETVLDFIDKEVVEDFVHQMRDRGMVVRLGAAVKEIVSRDNGVEVSLRDGRRIRTRFPLYAAGRSGNVEIKVRASGVPYQCGTARFRETSRGHIMGVDSGFLKLIFALDSRRLLGAHIIGEGATELIHIGQAVINLKGTVDFFVENTFNYPTLAEAYKVAGLDAWNRIGQARPTSAHATQRAISVCSG